ncbi:hypothetical protein PIB30_048225 [Stylosanthes scabra]|uniref:Uncharacterized protein n=1 Tax=Stylosanthes scabra TaxID=79078 RepID=A0ABU6UIE3_9FABA|nr:hypothetical protein [Stylosanthes scabra]
MELIELVANNQYMFTSDRNMKRGVMEMEKLEVAAMGAQAETPITCGLCGGYHENHHCCLIREDQPMEQANYMGNQQRQPYHDPNANTYNPGWKNHPNVGWGGNQNPKNNNFQNRPPYQPFQRPPFLPSFPQQQPNHLHLSLNHLKPHLLKPL